MEDRLGYEDLSDEDKIKLAIDFIAQSHPIPKVLKEWLIENELYDLLTFKG